MSEPWLDEDNEVSEEAFRAVLELLSFAQETGHPLDEESTVPSVQHVCRLADNGNSKAQFLAARYYIVNSEDEEELTRAVMWLSRSAEQGFKPACEFLHELMPEK